jgi:hypothetical protein
MSTYSSRSSSSSSVACQLTTPLPYNTQTVAVGTTPCRCQYTYRHPAGPVHWLLPT